MAQTPSALEKLRISAGLSPSGTVTRQIGPGTVTPQARSAAFAHQVLPGSFATQARSDSGTPKARSGLLAPPTRPGAAAPPTRASVVASQAHSGAVAPQARSGAVVPQTRPGSVELQIRSVTVGSQIRSVTVGSQIHSGTEAPQIHSGTAATQIHSGPAAPRIRSVPSAPQLRPSGFAPKVRSGTAAPQVHSGTAAQQVRSDTTTPQVRSGTVRSGTAAPQIRPGTAATQAVPGATPAQVRSGSGTPQARPVTTATRGQASTSSYAPRRFDSLPPKVKPSTSITPEEEEAESKDHINMAHCQLRGPLIGPLRERRRAELSTDHPVWVQSRQFQTDLMTMQQAIRRTPGIPSKVANELCRVLINQSQQINNAIRETVDDSSELRIQIDEANVAIMNLKINDTALKVDIALAEKRIEEIKEREEKAENRLARYHADTEQDRNVVRVIFARLTANEDEEEKAKIMDELITVLKEQLSASHSIEPEVDDKEPTAIDQAMARFNKAQAEETLNGGLTSMHLANLPTLDRSRLDNVTPVRGNGMQLLPYGSDSTPRGTFAGESAFSPLAANNGNELPVTMQPPAWPLPTGQGLLEGPDVFSNGSMRNGTPGHVTPGSQSGPNNGGTAFSRPAFRPKAPEFHPSNGGINGNGNVQGFGQGSAIIQMSNTSWSQHQRGYGPNQSPGPHQGHPRSRADAQGWQDGQNQHDQNGQTDGYNLSGPKRPQWGNNQYDNRAVVALSQPVIPLGQTYGGINDDLDRFESAFQELFGIARGFIGTWVGAEDPSNKRDAAIMQYLPKVYHPFTEQQAWSYIRQHLADGLARSCLFARVVVDFIVQRILVPTAWQGFGFQTDRRIQQVEADLSRGPMMTGSARSEYNDAVCDVVNSILDNERYEHYREGRIDYFATELQSMLGPLMNEFADLTQAGNDLRAVVGKAWSLSAKTLTSRMTFEYRFPDSGCRFSMQSMVAVAPNIDGYVLQAEHWRVQLVVTPVITVRNDNGSTLSVHVTNLAEVLLMK